MAGRIEDGLPEEGEENLIIISKEGGIESYVRFIEGRFESMRDSATWSIEEVESWLDHDDVRNMAYNWES